VTYDGDIKGDQHVRCGAHGDARCAAGRTFPRYSATSSARDERTGPQLGANSAGNAVQDLGRGGELLQDARDGLVQRLSSADGKRAQLDRG